MRTLLVLVVVATMSCAAFGQCGWPIEDACCESVSDPYCSCVFDEAANKYKCGWLHEFGTYGIGLIIDCYTPATDFVTDPDGLPLSCDTALCYNYWLCQSHQGLGGCPNGITDCFWWTMTGTVNSYTVLPLECGDGQPQ